MKEIRIPTDYNAGKSSYAGQEPEYRDKQIMQTKDGRTVTILQYLKNDGLYVVMEVGTTRGPAFKINPDKLMKTEKSE